MTENCKFRKAILSAFYNIPQRNFGILLILWCSFKLWWNFCLDLFRSKFSLLRKWSNTTRVAKTLIQIWTGPTLMRVDDSRSNVSRYVNLQISGIPFRANLKLVRELKDRRAQGRACGNLGNTYYLLGNFNKAIQYHREVSIFRFYYAVHMQAYAFCIQPWYQGRMLVEMVGGGGGGGGFRGGVAV